MERQTQEILLSFIKRLKTSVDSREKITLLEIKENFSIGEVILNIRNYVEWTKHLVFRKIISLTYKREINIDEFNEINDCLNREFDIMEEYIDDVLPELYDRNISKFREIYFQLHSSLSMIGYIIKHL